MTKNKFNPMQWLAWILLSISFTARAQTESDIQLAIHSVINDKRATVGIAILCDDGNMVVMNDDERYPVMSVFKFHVVVTALKKMEQHGIPLDSMTLIPQEQMLSDTYSPLREKYPNRDIPISYRNIIRYTMAHSDNNTCDFLIDFVGGISVVDSLIRQLGINKFAFSETEKTMHENILNCYNNWCTPSSMVLFLKKIYTEPILNNDHFLFLEQLMIETSTGTNKIKAGLPADVILGHKTGSSDRTKSGIKIGDNDAGIIYLPHNKRCYIAIFIKDSKENDTANAKIIADITEKIYEMIIR